MSCHLTGELGRADLPIGTDCSVCNITLAFTVTIGHYALRAGEAASIANRTASVMGTLQMRPKWAWGYVNAAMAALSALYVLTDGGWLQSIYAACYALLAIAAFRSLIRVEDGVLYRRGLLRWYAPLDLRRLHEVCLVRVFNLKEPYPHLELLLLDDDGNVQQLSLRWWSNWRRLVTVVARTVSAPPDDHAGRPTWLLDLDPKTRYRLESFLWADSGPRA